MSKKLDKLIEKIESHNMLVNLGGIDDGYYLSIKKNENKKPMIELCLDKKGNITDIVIGSPNNACWIDLKKHNK